MNASDIYFCILWALDQLDGNHKMHRNSLNVAQSRQLVIIPLLADVLCVTWLLVMQSKLIPVGMITSMPIRDFTLLSLTNVMARCIRNLETFFQVLRVCDFVKPMHLTKGFLSTYNCTLHLISRTEFI